MVEIFLKFHNFRSPFDSAAVQADAAARRGLAKRPSRAHGPPSARAPRGLAGRPPPRGALVLLCARSCVPAPVTFRCSRCVCIGAPSSTERRRWRERGAAGARQGSGGRDT